MDITNKRIVCLAPHPDDIEFGCGASVHRLNETGNELYYVAFSPCNKSLPEGFPENSLFNELDKASQIIGIAKDRLIKHDFPVRELPKHRQAILEILVKMKKEIQPDIVLLPNSQDVHQDHHQIHLEGVRAFKHCTILGYELPWNNLSFQSNFHIKVSESNLKAKVDAIQCYSSQKRRVYSQEAFIKGQAKMRGIQVNSAYAEAFECVRGIISY
jgi:LmbE family N-acetylglucosaminyl deacetylase